MAVLFTDEFNQPDNTRLIASGAWVHSYVYDPTFDMMVVGGIAYADLFQKGGMSPSGFSGNYTDAWVETVFHRAGTAFHAFLRMGALGRGYCVCASSTTVIRLYSTNGGGVSSFLGSVTVASALNVPVRLEAEGTTLRVYVDGVLSITSPNQTAYPSGYVGLYVGNNQNAVPIFGKFVLGNFAAASSPASPFGMLNRLGKELVA